MIQLIRLLIFSPRRNDARAMFQLEFIASQHETIQRWVEQNNLKDINHHEHFYSHWEKMPSRMVIERQSGVQKYTFFGG